MKASKFNRFRCLALFGLLLVWGMPAWAEGPRQEFIKTLNREFTTNANGMTALYNKYGTVNVKSWNKNSVKIDISIIVNANNQRDADRMFDRIQVNFTNTFGYVKAETMISEDKNGWWPNGNCQDFKINYEVWMPIGNQLDLKNRYGNSVVGDLNGKLTAEIKYGDLRTEVISNDADLNIGYGKATLTRVANLTGQVSYGGLIITEARDVQLDSKYSEVKVERANTLRITSKYDDFTLGTVDDLRLQTKYANVRLQAARLAYVTAQYTDVKIGALSEVADADLTYGSLQVAMLNKGFTGVNVVGKYTDVEISMERGTASRFDVVGNYADLHMLAGMVVRTHQKSDNHESKEGYIGDANARGLVKARLNYGDLRVK